MSEQERIWTKEEETKLWALDRAVSLVRDPYGLKFPKELEEIRKETAIVSEQILTLASDFEGYINGN